MKIDKVILLFVLLASPPIAYGGGPETVTKEVTIHPDEIKQALVFNWGNNAYSYHGPIVKQTPSDRRESPKASKLRLFEDGQPLGPPHSSNYVIATKGGGAYTHWYSGGDRRYAPPYLIFTTSDNSDPRTNGRVYTIKAPVKVYRRKLPRIIRSPVIPEANGE
jgi:hypothetical protein